MANHSSILAWKIPWREKRSLQGYNPHDYKESVKSEQWSTHTHSSILWFRKTKSNYFVILHSQCTVSKIWLMSEKSDEESMPTLTCHRLAMIQLHLHFHWPELNHMALNQLWEISLALSLGCVRLLRCHGLYSLPGSSVQGILQARILEWVVMPSSMGSSRPRYQTCISYVSCIGKFFTTSANWEAQYLFNTNLTFLCFCSCYFTNLNTHSPHCLPKF